MTSITQRELKAKAYAIADEIETRARAVMALGYTWDEAVGLVTRYMAYRSRTGKGASQ